MTLKVPPYQNLHRCYPPPFSWWEGYVYRQTAYAIAGNQDAVQVLCAKGYAGRVRVIPQFGVDPSLYGNAKAPPRDGFTIGYVGRLVPEKGIADLLRATSGLPGNWHIRLLGGGPEDLEVLPYPGQVAQSLPLRPGGEMSPIVLPHMAIIPH